MSGITLNEWNALFPNQAYGTPQTCSDVLNAIEKTQAQPASSLPPGRVKELVDLVQELSGGVCDDRLYDFSADRVTDLEHMLSTDHERMLACLAPEAVTAVGRPSDRPEGQIWAQRIGMIVALHDHGARSSVRVLAVGEDDCGQTILKVQGLKGGAKWVSPRQLVVPAPKATHPTLQRLASPNDPALERARMSYINCLVSPLENFPRLASSAYEVTGREDSRYNCIGESVGDRTHILFPAGHRVEDFDAFYSQYGYLPINGLDFSLCPGFEKVVVYAVPPGHEDYDGLRKHALENGHAVDGPIYIHGIVQLADGSYSSKQSIGGPRIRIVDPNVLGGGSYGDPVRVYIRPRRAQ